MHIFFLTLFLCIYLIHCVYVYEDYYGGDQ